MILKNVQKLLKELPEGVEIVAAAKSRTVQEIIQAIDAGIKIVGQNYVQEAKTAYDSIEKKVQWHMLGHLQRNKVKIAVEIFDMIETLDSIELATEIDKQCQKISKIMPVLIEVNIAEEPQKSGVMPEKVIEFAKDISKFKNIKLSGLMTMGPYVEKPEVLRTYFKQTKQIFEELKNLRIPQTDIRYLSMGMSNSYKIAVEEGANIVRIGTLIFGN